GEPGAADHFAKDVASVGDLVAVLGSGRGHATTVADSLGTTTAQTRVLSYDSYVGVGVLNPP
ncbi:hypothetical protein, partial [Mycobacterium bouchedurhonense]|uniref:hypothetical protein n=1 Tax=Mycobacterium bouchedurhonense TaxID=701041 RepID=UPI00361AEA1F